MREKEANNSDEKVKTKKGRYALKTVEAQNRRKNY